MAETRSNTLLNRALVIVGALVLVPALLLLVVGIAAPITGWGFTFLLGVLTLALGLLLTRRRRLLTRVGVSVVLAVLVMRCAVVHGGDPTIRVVTLGANRGVVRSLSGVVPERDLAMSGTRMLAVQGTVPKSFPGVLAAAYDQMEQELGQVPSALAATYLGQQSPKAFDTLVVSARGECRPKTAVVFLHGYAGNVTLLCWTVAKAVRGQGIATYCPSVGFDGDWWSRDGARTLRTTLSHLRAKGYRRVILAGLSNGANGASVLAPKFRRQLSGLVLISGLSSRAGRPGLPTLLVHGRRDPATPAHAVQRYLQKAAPRARHVSMSGDHFVLLTREKRVRRAIGGWIARRAGCR